jgi:hypothetical protein
VTSTPNRPAQNNRPATRTRATLTITAIILAVLIILFFIFAGLYSAGRLSESTHDTVVRPDRPVLHRIFRHGDSGFREH